MPPKKGSTAAPKVKAKAASRRPVDEEFDKARAKAGARLAQRPASANYEPKDKGVRLTEPSKVPDLDAAHVDPRLASPTVPRKRIGGKTSEPAAPELAAGRKQDEDDREPRTPDAKKQLAEFESPANRQRRGTPKQTSASPKLLGMSASPRAKSLAISAKKRTSTPRGGVLTLAEQQSFQAWLKRQRVAGTTKALEWSMHHQDEGWRREFHAAWKVQRENTRDEACQVSSHTNSTTTSGHDDWFTLFEFAAIEKLDPASTLCKQLFDTLPKRANRNAEFAEIEAMQEGHYVKAKKRKWEEVHATATTSSSVTQLDSTEAEELEHALVGKANSMQDSSVKAKTKVVKIKTLATESKKMKLIHKGLIGERILSEGYRARLSASDKEWAVDWMMKLDRAMTELAHHTTAMYQEMTIDPDMTLDKCIEVCQKYDDILRNYRRGVVAQVAAMLSGPE